MMIIYHVVGWSLPAISVIVIGSLDAFEKSEFGCWITENGSLGVSLRAIFFVVPFLIVVSVHIIQLMLQSTIIKQQHYKNVKIQRKISRMKTNANVFVLLFVILWIWQILDV